MNASSIRWGVSHRALLWASTMLVPATTVVAAPQEMVLHNLAGGSDGA
jgi:hypothetical protein